jgi:hypothetical protein
MLNEQQKQAVLGVVKTFAEAAPPAGNWEDESFVREMNSRFEDYKSGKVAAKSLDEVEASARAAIEELSRK